MDDVLRNPHRRKIIEILAKRKVVTPKEISEELRIGVPTVYYHLEVMKGYVVKTSRGEFAATEKGLSVFKDYMNEEISAKNPMGNLMPYFLFSRMASSPKPFILISLVIGAFEYLLCYFQSCLPNLLSYTSSIIMETLPLAYLGNLLILVAILEIFSYAVTRRWGGELALINGIILSRLPLMILLLEPMRNLYYPFSIVLLAVCQMVSIIILSITLSLSKGIRQELSIIVCLVILYLNILLYSLP